MSATMRVAVLVLGIISLGLAGPVKKPVTADRLNPPAATTSVENDQGGNKPPQVLADTTLYESFTGVTFPPTGWTRYNFTPNTNYWQRDVYDYRTSPACAGVGFYGVAANNDWLITPRLTIQGNDSLEFWFKASGGGYNERFKVRVCTTASVSDTGRYIPIFDTTIRSGTYRRRALSLSQFAGKQAFIAWYYYPTDQDWFYIDDVAVLRYPAGPANDMGGVGFVNPPGIIPPVAPVTITGIVRNLGSATQNLGVPVGLTINGPNAYIYQDLDQATTRSLASGQYETIAFVPNWTPPAVQGPYWLKVWTNLSGDANRANDTFVTYCYVYTGLFEQFTGAAFPPPGWDTAIVNGDYPWERTTDRYRSSPASARYPSYYAGEGEVAWLRTPRLDLRSGTACDSLIFWWLHPPYSPHTDTLETQISYDLGSAWITLGYLTGPMSSWQRIAYSLEGGSQNDSIYIRFVGRSQNCNDLHVDDVIGPPIRPLDRDVGCTHIEAPAGLLDSGIAVTPACSVYNSGDTAASFTVRMKIGALYNETATVTDQAQHTSAYVTFPSWIASPKGTIPVSCSTELAGDVRPANDRMTGAVEVHILNVGVTIIASPIGTIESSATVAPSARVKNFGDIAFTFKAFFWFDSTGAIAHSYSESLTVNTLSAGTESTVVFPTWGKPHPLQTYAAKCSTYLAGDRIPANDVVTGSFTVVAIIILPGWSALPSLPPGVKNKNVKDGGCLAYNAEDATDYIYALKGNNRYEFYKFNTAINTWTAMESIPAIGMTGKKKAVKKGATLVGDIDPDVPARVYAQKGNSTLDFWRYDPVAHVWTAVAPVPAGAKPCKEGCGAAVVDLGHSELGDSAYIYFLKGSGTTEFYRYSPFTNTWQALANAPAGPKGKTYKNGSCLAANDNGASKTIYALKGSYNELYAYDPVTDVWTTKTPLPLVGTSGKKKKVKEGAGIACYADHGGYLYAVKGGNTRELWKYLADSGDRWVQLEDIPIGGGKNVKGGGAITYAEGKGYFYMLKGNNTLEFYQYVPTAYPSLLAADGPNVMAGSALSPSPFALRLSPNPFTNATRVSYSLPKAGNVRLKLYDISGKLVATLMSGYSPAGSSSFIVHRSSFSAGIYLLRLELDDCSLTRKLILE